MATEMKHKYLRLRPLTGLICALIGTSVFAQQNISGAIPTPEIGNMPANTDIPSFNTDPTQERAWIIQPRISITETLTDNVNVGSGSGNNGSDLITDIAPGIRIQARTVRLKGYLDYALRGLVYANNPDFNTTQNQLNTFGTFEAIDNWFYLDFNGQISQQAISAFGTQSPSNGTVNRNSTETSNFGISPYIRGQLGSSVNYLLRYNQSTTRSSTSNVSNIDLSQWVGQLKGGTAFRNLNWAVDANQQSTDYSAGRKTEATLYRGIATYSVLPEFRVSLSAGSESNNYATVDQQSRNTHGYGFDWNPTERTQVSAFKEQRFFGDGHRFSLSHRFPMSSIRFTDTRDVSVMPQQFSLASIGTIYDLYFEQFASFIPDPVARANFVQALLASNGINPNTQVVAGFLSSQATLLRRQELAWTLFGARNSLTLIANRSQSRALSTLVAVNDDFTNNSLNAIEQRGLSVNFSHQLTALSNLNATVSRQESTGTGATNLKSTMTMYQASMTTKLGAKTAGSMTIRRSTFDSSSNPYTENALIGTLTYTY